MADNKCIFKKFCSFSFGSTWFDVICLDVDFAHRILVIVFKYGENLKPFL